MRLTINGEPISFTLENERTLGDVARAAAAWLGAAGFVVTALSADGQPLAVPGGSWEARPLEGVGELAVLAVHAGQLRVEHWRTLAAWMGALAAELGAPRPAGAADPLAELLTALPTSLESFTAAPFLPPGSDLGRRFEAALSGASAAEVRGWPGPRREEAAGIVAELAAKLLGRLEDAAAPGAALARSAATLRGLQDRLGEVSVLLQTGRDREAMAVVISFTDAAQALIDVLPLLPPHPERTRLLAGLTPVLRDLAAAFDARDGVLIGDLLEYEVAPRMRDLAPLLETTP